MSDPGSKQGSEDRQIAVEGVTLRVRIQGAGPPVLVLHGFTGSIESMEPVTRGLARGFTTIAVDLVGHGQSDAPAPASANAYRMDACLKQLGALLDSLGVSRAHVVGYSMGGRTGLALAAGDAGRVASLLIVGASAGLADPRERRARIAADEALADRIERDGVTAFVDEWSRHPLFASQQRLGPDFLARARQQRLRNRATGLAGSLRGMGTGAQPPLHDALAGLRLPLCLVVGAEDDKFRKVAASLAEPLPDARIVTLDRAGHAAHLENPKSFLREARQFLAEVQERRPAQFRAAQSRPRSGEEAVA